MMFFWPLTLVAGLAMLVVWVIRRGQGSLPMFGCMMGHGDMSHEPKEKSAVDILRERYARGEITTEEFEEISRALGH